MQTLRKKTSPCKYRNDPGRFFGDGVIFKAKLIGILEVGEARGDRMCQEALQDLKMAIRAAGEHKQRITINVTIDGLRLRDERTGDSLYHHPVHKISFIAQDMTDSRAFGYIFGSPDSGHRFFGIKTDKAASQVVLAMRDLFQVVFELKKKEIELARQHIQSKTIHEHQPITLTIKSSALESSHVTYSKSQQEPSFSGKYSGGKEMSPESVADLVDLEQELSSIQRGITQMERITPSEPPIKTLTDDDPFGDSFTQFPTYNLLPPPESSKSRHSKPLKPPEDSVNSAPVETTATETAHKNKTLGDGNWLKSSGVAKQEEIEQLNQFETNDTLTGISTSMDDSKINDESILQPISTISNSAQYIDAFSDLDPLGTGKSRPYIDKKYFFQDLKNPPKKVLKELSDRDGTFSANFASNSKLHSDLAMFEENKQFVSNASAQPKTSDSRKNSDQNDGSLYSSEFTIQLVPETHIFSPNNSNTHGIPPPPPPPQPVSNANETFNIDINTHKTDDSIIGNNRALLVTDNDPFSPRMKKFDLFDDDFSKKTMDPFEFEFSKGARKSTILPDTRIVNEEKPSCSPEKRSTDDGVFNGPLQVSLPPESYSAYMSSRRAERQTDGSESILRSRPNAIKQNTVDAISSISSMKMKPHIFSQKFSKRDSNMRRLQESDSFSENEAAPEPPPRPESNSHTEPPPLPPKKQFSDIVIKPRVTSPLATNRDSAKYDYLDATKPGQSDYNQQNAENIPALPLPSRRIGRTESNYPGPRRPEKKKEDDYLTPISIKADMPILLPPPQAKGSFKNRNRRQDTLAQNKRDASNSKVSAERDDENVTQKTIAPSIPDITLSQLLTLGIDDLASKLNVSPNKLNTMTIVELTKYLSDFIEKSSQKSLPLASDPPASVPTPAVSTQQQNHHHHQQDQQPPPPPPPLKAANETAVFKVSFDDSSDSTFIAKFDDNFGIDNDFIPNFDHFNRTHNTTVDKYAAFREIIEQELQTEGETPYDAKPSDGSNEASSDAESPVNEIDNSASIPTKIDTKITQAISQAKDRYAALRDIILVEDLFEKSANMSSLLDTSDQTAENVDNLLNEEVDKEFDETEHSSPDVNISINLEDHDESDPLKTITTPTISQPILGSKDDLEIDEYMNRAISNLSLDSRDHLSPLSKSPAAKLQNASTSPMQLQQRRPSPLANDAQNSLESVPKTCLNDMSTSPISIQKSPTLLTSILKSPASMSMSTSKSPIPLLSETKSPNQLSTTSISPMTKNETGAEASGDTVNPETTQAASESWAVFETDRPKQKESVSEISPKEESSKIVAESPYSSDDKADWKVDNKKWPRGHTSSSSRDLSPWDDDGPDYKRRGVSSHPDRHGFYMRHARRMNSCDDDYEYDGEMAKHRGRRNINKCALNRSRENFDSDSQNWYHPSNYRSWSPAEDDENGDRARSFERSSYERSTYGPPYEKRDPKSLSYSSDRHGYKGYDKRKYYRDYGRPGYDLEDYDEYEQRTKRGPKEYDEMYESSPAFGMRSHKVPKDYFYEREKRSFDRESTESFDSNGRRRKSFGSGDVYGSLDYRERYGSADRKRSLKKSNKNQRSNEEEYEQDSDGDAAVRRGPADTRSLQRQAGRPRKSSGSSPWEDVTPTSAQKGWKRPASATESERMLAENRRVLNHALSGSDGEKDRRFYRKPRGRDREIDVRGSYTTARYPSVTRGDDYEYEGADYDEEEEEQYRGDIRRKDRNAPTFIDRRKIDLDRNIESMHRISRSNRDVYYPTEKDRFGKLDSFDQQAKGTSRLSSRGRGRDFNYESYEDTPHPNVGTSKFNFETPDQGFESDFNAAPEKNLRFTAELSGEKESPRVAQHQHSQSTAGSTELITSTPPQQKLRFDDKITVSKFDLFEDDDFSKAEFSFENEDQWVEELPKKINLKSVVSTKRHENIKKSESVNIFAKSHDDPFEDDDFFKKSSPEQNSSSCGNGSSGKKTVNHNNTQNNNVSNSNNATAKGAINNNNSFKWENNFAKFEDNI